MRRTLVTVRGESGQSLVEFALVMPVLLLIVLGIIEFGWMFNSQITITSSAREGARVAVVRSTDPDKDTKIMAAIGNHVTGLSGLAFDSTALYDSHTALEQVSLSEGQVRAAAVYETVSGERKVTVYVHGHQRPLIGIFGFGSRDLWGKAVMQTE